MTTEWLVTHAHAVALFLNDTEAMERFRSMDINSENDKAYNEACAYLDTHKDTVYLLSTDPETGYNRSW